MDDNADASLSLRRLAALLFLGVLSLIMMAGRLGWGSQPPSPAPQTPASPATPAPPVRRQLALLAPCGQPNQIGAYRLEDAACRPSAVWTMTEFAAELTELKTLAEGERLEAPDNLVDVHCPFVVLNAGNLFQGRVCFSAEGSIYRVSDGGDPDWRWSLTAEGWMLEHPIAVASAN